MKKLTLKELRSIITEVFSEAATMVDVAKNPDAAHAAWPNVTWNGHHIIDDIYPLAMHEFESEMKAKGWEFQEVYLGYAPGLPGRSPDEEDEPGTFIMGWDVWKGDEGMTSAFQSFSIEENGDELRAIPDGGIEEASTGFYARNDDSGYSAVHGAWGKVVDLRLD